MTEKNPIQSPLTKNEPNSKRVFPTDDDNNKLSGGIIFDVNSLNNNEFGVPLKKVASTKSTKSTNKLSSNKPRPHVCSICTRAFARLEHLKRHERSHTNEKPFQCAACGRCFARRDLVLRHQQKLHASLPTNNRSNIQRKGKLQKYDSQDGEIIRDHLNDNINIVRNNTSAKLPVINNPKSLMDNEKNESQFSIISNTTNNHSSISPNSDNNSKIPKNIKENNSNNNDTTINDKSFQNLMNSNEMNYGMNMNMNMNINNLNMGINFQNDQMSYLLGNNNAIYNSPNSINGLIFTPDLLNNQSAMNNNNNTNNNNINNNIFTNSNITPESQNKSNANPDSNPYSLNDDNLNSDELDSDLDSENNDFDNPQAMYSNEFDYNNNINNNNNITTNTLNDSKSSNYRKQRHASFSAAASSSYTGFPDTKTPHAKNIEELEKEAPQQVSFSSPQLKYRPNFELGYVDLDLLDNLNLNDLGLDFSTFNFTSDLTNSTYNSNNHNNNSIDETSNNDKDIKDETRSESNQSNNGMSPRDINLQKVLSNPQNGVALQKVLSHPRSGEALQKVLSHPNSDYALQKVLSHPEPSTILEKVLTHPSDTEWFNEFINAPIETNFPNVSDHIGFTDSPHTNNINNNINNINNNQVVDSPSLSINISNNLLNNQNLLSENLNSYSPSSTNDLKKLFRSRQIDLSKHIPHTYQNPTIPGRCSESIRNHIMEKYNLSEQQFPQLDDLNHYLALYEIEFNKYFPFIHIPSFKIDENLDQIPLLLSMAAVGALYSFHARNSSTLFNFSRFLIHNFMEVQLKLHKFTDIPLHITQSLVLHMFLGMFHNDQEITKLISRQLNSLVSLIKTTKLDMPLESLLLPPNINSDLTFLNNFELVDSCFKYFILSQSRIRTIHVLHYITVLFGILNNSNIQLSFENMECGSPCQFDELWNCKNFNEWILILKEKNLIINSKFSLIMLSNGLPYKELFRNLQNLSLDKEIGLRGMLSLLLTLNEFIHSESEKNQKENNKSYGAKLAQWRMEQRPYIESLIKIWESNYIKNGGLLVPRGQNIHIINNSSILKLILPLLSFAKINKCVYISGILNHVWNKDWELMNNEIQNLNRDIEALRDSINYSLDIINLWIEIISINNDAEKTSIRTPIFFLTCLFTSTLLISEYLYTTEAWAHKYLNSNNNNNNLTTSDRVLWLRAEKIFKKIEQNLLPLGSNNQSYSEFLRMQANGALDVDILDDEIARLALEPGDLKPIAQIIVSGKLSQRCLSLGVRILADAPVWPVALLFAEALKARAINIHQNTSLWSPENNLSK